MQNIETLTDYNYGQSYKAKLRNFLRNYYIRLRTVSISKQRMNTGLRILTYHHVFNDEINGFRRQMTYLKNCGDFITMDDVATIIKSNKKITDNFFCITFDDGFSCCYDNMMNVTTAINIPVMIYLVTDWIGEDDANPVDKSIIRKIMPNHPKIPSFLNWQQCTHMMKNDIYFGSHTCSHVRLSQTSEEEVWRQLRNSKEIIERNLKTKCLHFAPPWGKVNVDYDLNKVSQIASSLGYVSAVSSNRGRNQAGDNLYSLHRDHILANWGNYQLKYFFSL